MDEINDFFDLSKEFKRKTVTIKSETPSCSKTIYKTSTNDENNYFKPPKKIPRITNNQDDGGHIGNIPHINNNNDEIYKKYLFKLNPDSSHPINKFRNDIITAIYNNRVVIIEGDTGCGKTTQVAQYILDDAYFHRAYCNIVCTQPRRIAAISIAKRVCAERKWEEGSIVGYQVGLHSCTSNDTRLLYCTTGVLLQKLIISQTLRAYTHIILDEVHERDQLIDFLLIIVRHLIMTNSKYVKIIIMSATMNTQEFSNYFDIYNICTQTIRCGGQRLYQIKEYYLDDIKYINTNNIDVDIRYPCVSLEMINLALKLIIDINNMEERNTNQVYYKTILIFLPGIYYINQMYDKIVQHNEQINNITNSEIKLYAIRLHSTIPTEEQGCVFRKPPNGYRKIIIATNIAESSITVPDVKYVIDFCLTKISSTGMNSQFVSLKLNWASRANCNQRAGRAGRVMNGSVYRLITRDLYENYFDEYTTPELQRCSLTFAVLNAKLLSMGPPAEILNLALNPPNISNIKNTVLLLKQCGGLYTYVKDKYFEDDGDISSLGLIMTKLPIHPYLTRLIILGYIFDLLEESIIIAAGLSMRSIFNKCVSNRENYINFYFKKLEWSNGSCSDVIIILRVYQEWFTLFSSNSNRIDKNAESSWALKNFINLRSMYEMHLLIIDLKIRLSELNIKCKQSSINLNSERLLILKVILTGAFYPNYFTYSKVNNSDKERDIYIDSCGHNPLNTVYFSNFDTRHIGQLYSKSIKKIFSKLNVEKENINVRFQEGSEKIFITFKTNSNYYTDYKMPGGISTEVYKALSIRLFNYIHKIPAMKISEEIIYAERYGLGKMNSNIGEYKSRNLPLIPSIFQKYIRGSISHVVSCSEFYFQPISDMKTLHEIERMLNNDDEVQHCDFLMSEAIIKGMILSAAFKGIFRRAKVIKIIYSKIKHKQFMVKFIDYGNCAVLSLKDLRFISDRFKHLIEWPSRLFECRLAMIEPSSIKSGNEQWISEANEYLQDYSKNGMIEINVYSVVDSIANVIIYQNIGTINDYLVERGLARKSDESYQSKIDHDLRLRKQSAADRFCDEHNRNQNEEYIQSFQISSNTDIDLPIVNSNEKSINLHGPFSPIEIKVYSALRENIWKSVNISSNSINYILLDTSYKDAYERLLVASYFVENHSGTALNLDSTTLMPNIHGFGALMTLLFCPRAQIKCNRKSTKYVAILAGLGYDHNTMDSFNSSDDITLNLDVDLLSNDLELINEMRQIFDTVLYMEPGHEIIYHFKSDITELKMKMKQLLLRLLSKNRLFMELHTDAFDSKWLPMTTENRLNNHLNKRYLFPKHSYSFLQNEKYEDIDLLTKNCHKLHKLRSFGCDINPIVCSLCNEELDDIIKLRIHLLSQLHRDREHQINYHNL